VKKLSRFFKRGLLILALSASFISCGIDDYIVLAQVASSNITVTLDNTQAKINLPPQTSDYFKNYVIYYRIYVSGTLTSATISESLLSGINATLANDYNAIRSYTNPDTNTTTNVGTLFTGRNYFTLNNGIPSPRNGGSFIVDFAFTGTMTEPSLNTSDPLRRSSDVTNPHPDRSFLNRPELYDPQYASSNRDVQPSSTGTGYTYVCMYICATGVDNNYSNINSKPTFIGVFLLPNPQ
jgi:hypothetical protein